MSVSQVALQRPRPKLFGRLAAIGPVASIAGAICLLLVLAAVFAPIIAPFSPTHVEAANAFAEPGGGHPLGTDDTGRDILSRLIWGARPSLLGPALVILIATTLGTFLAILLGWRGGLVDAAGSRAMDILLAFPGLILAIIAAAMFGAGFLAPVIALSIAYIPILARILRAAMMRERRLPYIAALRVQGMSGPAICVRHILPNLAPLIFVQAAVGFGYAMLDLAAISFLGLGVQPPTADWGVMAAEGQPSIINGYPAESLSAALIVVVAVVSINLVGERLAQHFDISEVA